MPNCNRCGNAIKWPEPFHPGNKPLNLDDSPHNCTATPSSTQPSAPVADSNAMLAECRVFLTAFKDVPDAKFDSLARIYNTLRMRR